MFMDSKTQRSQDLRFYPKIICRFKAIPTIIPAEFFVKVDPTSVIYMEMPKP